MRKRGTEEERMLARENGQARGFAVVVVVAAARPKSVWAWKVRPAGQLEAWMS